MTYRRTFCLVVGAVALIALPTHDARADRVAIGNTAGGVSTFAGDPSNLTAGPGSCCFLGDGQISVEWLDFDNLAVGSHSAASPTSSDVSVRQPFNGFSVTRAIGGIGAPLNTLSSSLSGDSYYIGAANHQNTQIRGTTDGGLDACCSSGAAPLVDSVGRIPGGPGPDGRYALLTGDTGPTQLRRVAFNQLQGQNAPHEADIEVSLSGVEVGTSIALLSDGNLIVGKKGVDFDPVKGGVTRVNSETLADMGGNCCHPDPVIDVDGDSQGRGIYITSGSVANGELVRTDFAGGNAILAGGGLNNSASGAMTALAVLSNDDILIGFDSGDVKHFTSSGTLTGIIGNVGAAVNSISVVVPEPAAGCMLLLGVAAAGVLRTRRS